jgi:hypothetical protein
MVRWGSAEAPVPRNDVSFQIDQKTANFKAAIMRRPKQWSDLPEGKQKNELAGAEFRFIRGCNYFPPSIVSASALHCSKDGQLPGGLC